MDTISRIRLFAIPTSPFAIKVSCYLAYKRTPYEMLGVSPISFKQVAFTGKRQVPVLQIDDEWKLESQEIGLWLDTKFPDNPMLGSCASDRAAILALDQWVTDKIISAMFRAVVDWPSISAGIQNGWKLASAVNRATPLPCWVRFMWPLLLRRAKFILLIVNKLDRREPLLSLQNKLIEAFKLKLNGGPFLGGMSQPSMADLSAYAAIVFPYRFGIQGDADWLEETVIRQWALDVGGYLPDNPFLVSSDELRIPVLSS